MKNILVSILTIISIDICAQEKITSYVVKNKQHIKLYYKNESGEKFTTIENLKNQLSSKKQQLVFAMNGGMFTPEFSPVGLYIDNYRQIKSLSKARGGGNFGLKPNGVFYITSDNKAAICKTEDFHNNGKIKYATQSGPMLVINGQIHPAFKRGSSNVNIRNGVGILPDGNVLFAITKEEVNFYDFAMFFKQKGCKNALFLDGSISEMYCPEVNMNQTSGWFGVIIGVTK
jgi:uncharacterized protein YigE (DUF2233 family)